MAAVPSLEAWKCGFYSAVDPAKERLIGIVQPREHVLQDAGVDGGVLEELRAAILQLSFLLKARDGDAAL